MVLYIGTSFFLARSLNRLTQSDGAFKIIKYITGKCHSVNWNPRATFAIRLPKPKLHFSSLNLFKLHKLTFFLDLKHYIDSAFIEIIK